MIAEAIRNIRSTKKDLRSFGLVMAAALAVIGGLLLWKQNTLYWVFFACAAAMAVLGLAVPVVLWPLHKVWMLLAGLVGWIMSRIILTVLYCAVIAPFSLAARLFGKRFVDVRFRTSDQSYWKQRDLKASAEAGKTKYEEQF